MTGKLVGLATALAVAGSAHAEVSRRDSIFGEHVVGGTACDSSNVEVQKIGGALVVLLPGLGVDMPFYEYGDGLQARKTCTIRIAVDVPEGYRLKRLRQVYSGGIVKSEYSSLRLQLRHNVGALTTRPTNLVFGSGTAIYPDDRAALFEEDLSVDLPDAQCGADTTYGMNVTLTAARDDYFEFLHGGLDYIVSGFLQQLRLAPELERCR